MLGHPVFRDKIREWLKVLRKANCAVVLATQSISDAERSGIVDVLKESCPTKICLPNGAAIGYNVPIAIHNPVAPPARHRDESPETLIPGDPRFGLRARKLETLPTVGGNKGLRSRAIVFLVAIQLSYELFVRSACITSIGLPSRTRPLASATGEFADRRLRSL